MMGAGILDGLDVSQHNLLNGRAIDWLAVAEHMDNQGIADDQFFVAARLTHGGHGDDNLRVDTQAQYNVPNMRRAFPASPRLWYHFLGTGNPTVQVDHFARALAKFGGTAVGDVPQGEGVFLDVEPDEPARVPVLPVEHILATLQAMEDRFKLLPGLYIGRYYPGSLDRRLWRYPLFLPVYGTRTKFDQLAREMGRPVAVWQWGGGKEGATVPGITGRIDSNEVMRWDILRTMLRNIDQGERPGQPVTLPESPASADPAVDYPLEDYPMNTRYYRAQGYANVVAVDFAAGIPVLPMAGEALPPNSNIVVIAPDPDRPAELHPMIARLYSLAGITGPKPLG